MKKWVVGSWVPHAGQREFLRCNAKIRVLACGRRWGKTDACAASIVASLFRPSPRKHVIIAPTQAQADLLFERCLDMLNEVLEARRDGTDGTHGTDGISDLRSQDLKVAGPNTDGHGQARTDRTNRTSRTVRTNRTDGVKVRRTPFPRLDFNGHRVMARSGSLGRALRGNEATDIVVDEAAYVPEKLITEVVMPMLATTNGTLTLIGTPCGMNHFWRWFRLGQEARGIDDLRLTIDECPEAGDSTNGAEGADGTDGARGTDEKEGTEPSPPTPSPFSSFLGKRRGGAPLSIWSKQAPSWESPYVSKEFLAVQRELISERAYRIEYGAEFLDSTGRVFRTEAIEACLEAGESLAVSRKPLAEGTEPSPPTPSPFPTGVEKGEGALREDLNAGAPYFIGIDWARYADYTAVVVLSGTRKGARLVCAERFHGMSWPDLVDGVAAICERYSECLAMCDATGIGDAVEGMLRKRLPWLKMKSKKFSASFKAELAEEIAWMLENGRLKMRPHPELIRELQHFEATPSSMEGRWKFGAPEGFHDDLVIALGLACELLPSDEEFRIWVGKPRSFDFAQDDKRLGEEGVRMSE